MCYNVFNKMNKTKTKMKARNQNEYIKSISWDIKK